MDLSNDSFLWSSFFNAFKKIVNLKNSFFLLQPAASCAISSVDHSFALIVIFRSIIHFEILSLLFSPKEPPPPPPPDQPWSETSQEIVHLNDANFKDTLKKRKHVLLMFYAPCKLIFGSYIAMGYYTI